MEKKNVTWSVKPTDKNRVYLRQLGFIDGRSGKVRPEMNLNKFLNDCITMVCEAGMSDRTRGLADNNDLFRSWKKYQLGLKARELARIQKEIVLIGNMKTEAEVKKTAMDIMISAGNVEDLIDWE